MPAVATKDVQVRRVPVDVLRSLRERAKSAGRSLNDELVLILSEQAPKKSKGQELIERIRAFRESTPTGGKPVVECRDELLEEWDASL